MTTQSEYGNAIDHHRRLWSQKSQLIDGEGGQYIAYTHDISLDGMSIFADKYYKLGQLCQVDVPVFVETGLHRYRFDCRVLLSSLCGMRGFRTTLEFLDVTTEHKTFIQSVISR